MPRASRTVRVIRVRRIIDSHEPGLTRTRKPAEHRTGLVAGAGTRDAASAESGAQQRVQRLVLTDLLQVPVYGGPTAR
jgi:hypothetical protein